MRAQMVRRVVLDDDDDQQVSVGYLNGDTWCVAAGDAVLHVSTEVLVEFAMLIRDLVHTHEQYAVPRPGPDPFLAVDPSEASGPPVVL